MSDYIEESIRQCRYQVAHRLIKLKILTFEQIAEATMISLDEVIEISQHPEYFKD